MFLLKENKKIQGLAFFFFGKETESNSGRSQGQKGEEKKNKTRKEQGNPRQRTARQPKLKRTPKLRPQTKAAAQSLVRTDKEKSLNSLQRQHSNI